MLNKEFNTAEEGMEILRKGVKVRNNMGGALYWSVLNDECCQIANRLLSIGGNRDEIRELLGEGNFR